MEKQGDFMDSSLNWKDFMRNPLIQHYSSRPIGSLCIVIVRYNSHPLTSIRDKIILKWSLLYLTSSGLIALGFQFMVSLRTLSLSNFLLSHNPIKPFLVCFFYSKSDRL